MDPVGQRVGAFMRREGIFPSGRVVVGLSGGADSVALLSLLRSMEIECTAVHCHFGLRPGEADRDLAHSELTARRLGADFESVRFNTRALMESRGISAEMACRELRYDHFEAVRRRVGAEFIAVAHHRDDNIETLFLNLLRGSGLHGLRGMLPRNGRVIRPLLELSRADILDYLKRRGLDYVTDSTNASSDFARNRLRNEVLPALYAAFPDAAGAIGRSLENLRGNDALYCSLLPPRMPTLAEIKASAAPSTLIHELLSPLGFNPAQTRAMLDARSGTVFTSATHRVEIGHGIMEIGPLEATAPAKPKLGWRIIGPEDFAPRPGRLYLDASAMEGNPQWELRPARTGDRMRPFGMKGTRLLSDIFASAKLSASQKRSIWVLTRNGQILWAVGLRASALFPVTESSTRIIEIHEETSDQR